MSKVIDPEMLGDMRRFGDLDVSDKIPRSRCDEAQSHDAIGFVWK